jgi:hypothetical protein
MHLENEILKQVQTLQENKRETCFKDQKKKKGIESVFSCALLRKRMFIKMHFSKRILLFESVAKNQSVCINVLLSYIQLYGPRIFVKVDHGG